MNRTQKTAKVMRLGLELQGIGKEEMAVLRQHCDVKSGYSREILAPAEVRAGMAAGLRELLSLYEKEEQT